MANAYVAFVSATNEPIPKRSYRANIVNVITSPANVIRAYYAVDQITAFVNVATAIASQAGKGTIAPAAPQTTLACHRMEERFVRAMATAFAVPANVKRQAKDVTRENSAKNAQRVQAVVMNSRNACNAKFTKQDPWAIIQNFALKIAHFLFRKELKC